MRTLISVFPDLAIDEFEKAFERTLNGISRAAVTRIDHGEGAVFPPLSEVLAAHPAAEAFTFFDQIPINGFTPSTVVRQFGNASVPWRPAWVRALSEIHGGWAYSMLADEQRLEYALGTFYSGRALDAAMFSSGQDKLLWREGEPALTGANTWPRFVRSHQWLGGGQEADLSALDGTKARTWLVHEPIITALDPEDLRADPLCRAVFIGQEEQHVRDAVGDAAGTFRYFNIAQRHSPVMYTPFVILDADISEEQFYQLARRLKCDAVRMEILYENGKFYWTEVRADGASSDGKGQGALSLSAALGAIAHLMHEPMAIIH